MLYIFIYREHCSRDAGLQTSPGDIAKTVKKGGIGKITLSHLSDSGAIMPRKVPRNEQGPNIVGPYLNE